MGHVTYTSKKRRLTTKNVISADICSHLASAFFVLNGHLCVSSWSIYQKLALSAFTSFEKGLMKMFKKIHFFNL
jgi:hypothetical protein